VEGISVDNIAFNPRHCWLVNPRASETQSTKRGHNNLNHKGRSLDSDLEGTVGVEGRTISKTRGVVGIGELAKDKENLNAIGHTLAEKGGHGYQVGGMQGVLVPIGSRKPKQTANESLATTVDASESSKSKWNEDPSRQLQQEALQAEHDNVHGSGPLHKSRARKRQMDNIDDSGTNSKKIYTGKTRASNDRLPPTECEPSIPPTAALARQFGPERLRNAKSAFISEWVSTAPAVANWHNLEAFTWIGKASEQEPFQELGLLMRSMSRVGDSDTQAAFRRSVHTSLAKQASNDETEVPEHLIIVDGFDAQPFQRFWKATILTKRAQGAEGIAIILRRKAIVEQLAAYHDVIQLIRNAIKERQVKLRHGEIAAAKAREFLFKVLYKDTDDRKAMRAKFDYDSRAAKPYYDLCQHYGNEGILAMVPFNIREVDLRFPARIPAMKAILDVIRPDFHGPRLELYSTVINMVEKGQIPDQDMVTDLDNWASTGAVTNSA